MPEAAYRMDELPDLPEIMSYGVGLTDALRIWCDMKNTPGITPDAAREELKRCLKPWEALSARPGVAVH